MKPQTVQNRRFSGLKRMWQSCGWPPCSHEQGAACRRLAGYGSHIIALKLRTGQARKSGHRSMLEAAQHAGRSFAHAHQTSAPDKKNRPWRLAAGSRKSVILELLWF